MQIPKWLIFCIGIGIAAIVAIAVFKVPLNTMVYASVLLACPLLHILMMKGGDHKHHQ